MQSPFKFLDSFTIKDKANFFGREEEIRKLYQMVFQSSIVTVYGRSGTGKTSLIQCGLASRFDGPDWLPIFIRRGQDINASLSEAVNSILPEPYMSEDPITSIQHLYTLFLRPVYLIFDQFEELYIMGSPKEQARFVGQIRAIIKRGLSCHILLVIREEYLGYLYDVERDIPNLLDFRLRVEPMDANRINEVIRSSFTNFNISLEDPQEENFNQIAAVAAHERFNAQLSYLQVYLDTLYRSASGRAPAAHGDDHPSVEITKRDIEKVGGLESIFASFIDQQVKELDQELQPQFSNYPEGAVRRILNLFVTAHGTKRPMYFKRIGDEIEYDQEMLAKPSVRNIPFPVASACIAGLEKRRILRSSTHFKELIHDSLAATIDKSRTEEERDLNKIRIRFQANVSEHQHSQAFLNEKQLNEYTPYFPKLQLTDKELKFIEESRKHIAQRKIDQENARRSEIRRKRLLMAVLLVAVTTLLAFTYRHQRNQEIIQKGKAQLGAIDISLMASRNLKLSGNYSAALVQLDTARSRIQFAQQEGAVPQDSLRIRSSYIDQIQDHYIFLKQETEQEKQYLNRAEFEQIDTLKLLALNHLARALKQAEPQPPFQSTKIEKSDAFLQEKYNNLENQIHTAATEWYGRAGAYAQYGTPNYMSKAQEALDIAIKLDPSRRVSAGASIRQIIDQKRRPNSS